MNSEIVAFTIVPIRRGECRHRSPCRIRFAISRKLPVLHGKQFEVISFDETAALFHNQNFGHMAGNSVIKELKAGVNYAQGNGFANIQDRIRNDKC